MKNLKQKFPLTINYSSFAKEGFTLAEVLITLGIIGVVATITIPVLMNNIQDNQYKVAYKKAYSTISQAFQKAQGDNNIIPLTGTFSSQGGEANFAAIKDQFKIAKDCDAAHLSACWNISAPAEKFRGDNGYVPAFVDNSEMAWKLRDPDSSQHYPAILVDTNGNKEPNQYGKDRFAFIYASSSVGWGGNDMGMPTKIVPFQDIITSTADNLLSCPSLASHPCYYTQWLYN